MEIKSVTISQKRQFTIPLKFFKELEFDTKAECMIRGNEIIIRPIKSTTSDDFAEQILRDLIEQGYQGNACFLRLKRNR